MPRRSILGRISSIFSSVAVSGCGVAVLLTAWGAAGCAHPTVPASEGGPSPEALVAFYSPKSIKILPFTKPRSFDSDPVPDGIEVSLRTLDNAGDPVKAYGKFLFELYARRNAAGNPRGERLQVWDQTIDNLKDQKQFWERVTSTYQFQLSWEGQPIAPQRKYVLDATYQTPGGERLFDTYELEFRIDRQEILNAYTGGGTPEGVTE